MISKTTSKDLDKADMLRGSSMYELYLETHRIPYQYKILVNKLKRSPVWEISEKTIRSMSKKERRAFREKVRRVVG